MAARVVARPAGDDEERQAVERLAAAHAPADLVLRARMVTLSWAGFKVSAIAAALRCRDAVVRAWLHRFNLEGVGGLQVRDRPGRPRRLGADDRSRIIAVAESAPPSGSHRHMWTLNELTEVLRARHIEVSRAQVWRIVQETGSTWREVRARGSRDPDGRRAGGASGGSRDEPAPERLAD